LQGARDAAAQLAQGPSSLGAIRQLIARSADSILADQLDRERDTQHAMGKTADYREGVFAFLEKRPPRFEGR
jgi:2-(1,2-epoxy-1,2-dihydrophenyl)acetyl-CoA isomerase